MTVSWGMQKDLNGGWTQEIETKIRRIWMMMNGYGGSRLCGG